MTSSPESCAPTPLRAWIILLVALLCAVVGVWITLSPLRSGFAEAPRLEAPGDVQLYNAEVARMRQGEPYYLAAGVELRSRGYPTGSVFNWRTPLPMWFIAWLPHWQAGQWVIGALSLVLVLLGMGLAGGEGGVRQGLLTGLLLLGAVMPCLLGELYVMPVLWAGVMIGLSVCCYGLQRHGWGLAFALAALFLRELAGPYYLLCGVLALRDRRWSEVLAWTTGMACYGLFFLAHIYQVELATGPNEPLHERSWLALGGPPFVISLVQMNTYLLISPQWLSALYLAAAMLGLSGWKRAAGERIGLTVCGYLVLFCVVGQPFNQYWGCLIAPLLCFPAARFPARLKELVQAAMKCTPGINSVVVASSRHT